MTYKNRLIFLLSVIFALLLIYAGSFIFNPDVSNSRSASHVWLDANAADKVNRFVLDNGWNKFEFIKKNDQWFVKYNNNEYPARRFRIDDFLGVFTARSQWPIRSSSAEVYDRFGLDERASRVTFYDNFSILLDLFLGDDDILGRESYFREAGKSEIRSGDIGVRTYLTSAVTSWYNLRLIPQTENRNVTINDLQRLSIYHEGASQIFSRSGRSWEISGINVENPDMANVVEFINFVLNAEGEDFIDAKTASEIDFNYSRIILEFGNGDIITTSVSGPDEMNKRYAKVSSSDYIYQIPLWVTVRLFRTADSFETE
ncbi:MAG: hypothetical protein FWC21_02285 [Treponema sp.]|nr:hypothetical protein [Treponema sp.]